MMRMILARTALRERRNPLKRDPGKGEVAGKEIVTKSFASQLLQTDLACPMKMSVP